jgi:hypothetical protein
MEKSKTITRHGKVWQKMYDWQFSIQDQPFGAQECDIDSSYKRYHPSLEKYTRQNVEEADLFYSPQKFELNWTKTLTKTAYFSTILQFGETGNKFSLVIDESSISDCNPYLEHDWAEILGVPVKRPLQPQPFSLEAEEGGELFSVGVRQLEPDVVAGEPCKKPVCVTFYLRRKKRNKLKEIAIISVLGNEYDDLCCRM